MKINPHLIKHIDKTSMEMIEWFDVYELKEQSETTVPHKPDTSFSHKKATNLTEYLVESAGDSSSKIDVKGEIIDKWFTINNRRIGLNEENYKKYNKFIKSVHVHPDIEPYSSFQFLSEIIFNWAIKVKENGKADNNLSNEISSKISDSSVKRTYCFPILNLEIFGPFNIGPIHIKFFRKDDFDHLSANFTPKDKNHENPFPVIRELYEGMVVASSNEIGEPIQCENIALSKCLIALDILKICSDTIEIPDLELSFDIDMRAKYQLSSQIISHNLNTLDHFSVTKKRLPKYHQLDSSYLSRMRFRRMDEIARFVFQSKEPDELYELVVNALSNFGEALSTGDLHKRIVELFSIFESLLIPSDSHPIQESIYKYGTHLIFTELKDRRELKKLFTEMYKVRSAMIHHGKRKEFKLEKLRKLQIALLMLILEVINQNSSYHTKEALISSIDDKLDSA